MPLVDLAEPELELLVSLACAEHVALILELLHADDLRHAVQRLRAALPAAALRLDLQPNAHEAAAHHCREEGLEQPLLQRAAPQPDRLDLVESRRRPAAVLGALVLTPIALLLVALPPGARRARCLALIARHAVVGVFDAARARRALAPAAPAYQAAAPVRPPSEALVQPVDPSAAAREPEHMQLSYLAPQESYEADAGRLQAACAAGGYDREAWRKRYRQEAFSTAALMWSAG